jgi:hypothetical protein
MVGYDNRQLHRWSLHNICPALPSAL